jgi:hypothetical protein
VKRLSKTELRRGRLGAPPLRETQTPAISGKATRENEEAILFDKTARESAARAAPSQRKKA